MTIETLNQEEIDLILELVKDERKDYAELGLFSADVVEENLEFLDQIVTKLEEALLKV